MNGSKDATEMAPVLIFGSYDCNLHPRIEVIHEGLKAAGVQTEEINVPLGLSSVDRIAIFSKPLKAIEFFLRLLSCWLQLVVRASQFRRRTVRTVIIGYMGHLDILLAKLLFPRAIIALDYLVSFRHAAQDRSIDVKGIRTFLGIIDYVATTVADIVLVDTEENIPTVPSRNRSKAQVVSVGASGAWFRKRQEFSAEVSDSSGLNLIFFGTYSPLQGVDTIANAIINFQKNEANFQLTMVGNGPGRAWVEERLAPLGEKVHFIDWLPQHELIKAVQKSDVCLGIFGTSKQASRVVPNKIFQGSASGCAIITADSPPQRRMMRGAALYVAAGDAEALASVLMSLSADRERVRQMKSKSLERALQCFQPKKVVEPLIGLQ